MAKLLSNKFNRRFEYFLFFLFFNKCPRGKFKIEIPLQFFDVYVDDDEDIFDLSENQSKPSTHQSSIPNFFFSKCGACGVFFASSFVFFFLLFTF